MKEQFVNFKTAVLAKEKGFNVETLHFYCKNRTCNYIKTPYKYSFEVNANQERLINGEIDNFGYGITWSAPTQSLLQRWIREVHKIHLTPTSISQESWQCHITRIGDNLGTNYIEDAYTYEQALEAGLLEALKLIK